MVSAWTILYITIICCAVIGVLVFLFMELRYKHRVIIRELAKGRKLIKMDRARDFMDRSKKNYWKLRKERNKIMKLMPVPPPESTEIMKRGKKFVEVYRNEGGEYIFIEDAGKSMDIPQELHTELDKMIEHKDFKKIDDENERVEAHKEWKENQIEIWKSENNVIAPLRPLTSDQRMALVNNIRKAEERNPYDWKRDAIAIAGFGGIIIMVVIAAIFAPDIIKTYTEGATQISNSLQAYEKVRHDNLMEEMKQWEKVTGNIQTITNVQLEQGKKIEELEKRDAG